jgi:hypothetical protein
MERKPVPQPPARPSGPPQTEGGDPEYSQPNEFRHVAHVGRQDANLETVEVRFACKRNLAHANTK